MPRRSHTAPHLCLAVLLALSVCFARAANAQDGRPGRLEGRVIDSAHARPLVGTRVVAAGIDVSAGVSRAAITDSAGRYRIDSLPTGRYAVGFESPLLDSLEINLSPRTVVVASGQTASIDLAIPPAAKLRGAMCPGLTLPPQTGMLFGHVVDASSESPLPDVVLAVSWQERDVDRATLRPVTRERIESATTGADGWYRLCGVPTDTWLSLQIQHGGRTGPVIRALVGDTLGITVRHLSFDASTARLASDSAASTATTDSVTTVLLSGTAMLSGVVRGTGDVPLASAEVRVSGARATGTSDALGRYSISALPAGSQMLEIRRVGYSSAEIPVDLRSGAMVTRDVRLQRVVNLDSIRVVASQSRYPEFIEHRKRAVFGIFLGPEEMQSRSRVTYATDVIEMVPGYRIVGEGRRAEVINGRGPAQCKPNIVIDGLEKMTINDVNPMDIGAIAAYRMEDFGPPEFDHGCGAIIIWTKR